MVTDPNSAAVGYAYDSGGDRLTLTYPDCRAAHSAYGLAGRLTQVSPVCQDAAAMHCPRSQLNDDLDRGALPS